MTKSPGTSAVVNVPTEVLSLLRILPFQLNKSILGVNSIDFQAKCNKRLKIFQEQICEQLSDLVFTKM